MKNFKLLFLFPLILSIISCQVSGTGKKQNASQADETALRDEIFKTHDEAMAQMGDLHRLKKQLRDISKDASLKIDSTTHEKLTQVLAQLDKAGNGMMEWMAAFKQPTSMQKQKSHDEIMAYLQEEKNKVATVQKDILESIEAATELLDELKK